MSIEILIIFCLVLVFGAIILFMNIRDKEINRRLEIFERTIEDINHQNFEIKNMVKEKMFQNTLDENPELREMLEKEVQSKIEPLQKSLKEVEDITKDFQVRSKESVSDFVVTEDTAEINENFDYEKKICELYDSGKTEDEIADLLGLKESEVAFVLSLNNK